MASQRHRSDARKTAKRSVGARGGAHAPAPQRPARKRPPRFSRGPFVIGEAAVPFEAGLSSGEPYRPDTIVDGGTVFGLTVRAASVRGLGKRFSGRPRQDDVCLGRHEPTRTLIAAVADGVSGAARSDLAAALAVRHAVAAVARQLDRGEDLDWQQVFGQAAWALVEEHRRASGERDASGEQAAVTLSTTLLVAAVRAGDHGGAHVQLAHVGDSPASLLAKGRFEPLLGSAAAGTLVGGAVQALPRAAGAAGVTRCELRSPGVLVLSTDGFAMPLAEGDGEVGSVFARELVRAPAILDFARLLDFSRATYDDDRSLIAVWPAREA